MVHNEIKVYSHQKFHIWVQFIVLTQVVIFIEIFLLESKNTTNLEAKKISSLTKFSKVGGSAQFGSSGCSNLLQIHSGAELNIPL